MSIEYKPRDAQDLPLDPERCRAATPCFDSQRYFQCQRKAAKDGWCWQHNPVRVQARLNASYERHKQKQENTPQARCQKELVKITAQRDLLLAVFEAEDEAANHFANCYRCGGYDDYECGKMISLVATAQALRKAAIAAAEDNE